jgi:rhodanese-related sulfurtransferase
MENVDDIWKGIDRSRGIPEVSAQWVSNNIDRVRIIDVREPAELQSQLGKIEESENVPLGTLANASHHWDRSEPIVVLCRSGGRSGRAAAMLEQKGFSHVASMDGGMLVWNELGLPTV